MIREDKLGNYFNQASVCISVGYWDWIWKILWLKMLEFGLEKFVYDYYLEEKI